MSDLKLDSMTVEVELEAAQKAIEKGETVMFSPDVAACLLDTIRGSEAVRDDEPVRLRDARNKIEALHHGATHEYADGYNNGVRAAVRVLDEALAALPDEPVTPSTEQEPG